MPFAEQRTDVTQSYEDFERILEDYLGVVPPDSEFFKMEKVNRWVYDDNEQSIMFYFEDDWVLDEFKDALDECPATNVFFAFEEFEHVDREKLTITVVGKLGGLI